MPQTRWLTEDEQLVWRDFITASLLLVEQLDGELQKESGVNRSHYEILIQLAEASNRKLRMSELADRSLSSRSRMSHAVNRLEEMGWIARSSCESDGRGFEAELTNKGLKALEKAAPGHVAGVRQHLFDQLSKTQVKQLGEISKVLATHLKESRGCAGDSSSAC